MSPLEWIVASVVLLAAVLAVQVGAVLLASHLRLRARRRARAAEMAAWREGRELRDRIRMAEESAAIQRARRSLAACMVEPPTDGCSTADGCVGDAACPVAGLCRAAHRAEEISPPVRTDRP